MLRALIVYALFAVRLFNTSVVTAPDDELPAAKFPVDISSVVPTGFVFSPNVTLKLVLYITNPVTEGGTDNVYVDTVTVTLAVDPPVVRFPACSP